MRRRGEVDEVKNRSGQWERPGGGGSSTGALCTGYPLVIVYSMKYNQNTNTNYFHHFLVVITF
jgi:hypothetical protein